MASNPDEDSGDLEARIKERQARMDKIQAELDRAKAVDRSERVDKVTTGLKLGALAVAVLLVLAGGVWAVTKLDAIVGKNECNFHEHASFRVADGEQFLSFQNPRFDMKYMAMKAHMHQPNDYQIHLEGGCANVKQFFSLIGSRLSPGDLKLDDTMHGGKDLRDNGNTTLQFYLYHNVDGNWTWTPFPNLPGHQLRDKQRMLLAYGNYTTPELDQMEAAVPAPNNQ